MKHLLAIAISAIIYCEFIADYAQLFVNCKWPKLDEQDEKETATQTALRAMILSDTHLLGPINGHWLDKFYREWHMHRAFQAAMNIFQPEVVFVLGDLFDEGDLVGHTDFEIFVQRFRRQFRTPVDVPLISAVGNHDVGFHYK